jgi:hypothetical protein
MPVGRPSSYSNLVAGLICEAMAAGQTLTAICRSEMLSLGGESFVTPPHISTVFRWLAQFQEFRDMYARAREAQADVWAQEIIDIADDSSGDTITTEKGAKICDAEWVNRSRLRVDARKWAAAKGSPRKYGDRLELAGDKDNPLVVADWATVMREERAKRLAKEPQS